MLKKINFDVQNELAGWPAFARIDGKHVNFNLTTMQLKLIWRAPRLRPTDQISISTDHVALT